ncbi:MAG TPA: MG2 domain-containing protein, partial [Terriglobales bacterium]|nr:MG2 domain-containing protein [Terriglobales bacterium]
MQRTAVLVYVLLLPLLLAAQSAPTLRVDEAATRVELASDHSVLSLAVVNPWDRPVAAQVRVEALDPQEKVRATADTQATLRPGASSISLPISLAVPTEKEQAEVLWYRLRYRVVAPGLVPVEGIVALAEITPEIFDLRVATPEFVTPGTDFPVRVRAQHPVTQRPVRGVSIAAKLEFDNGREPLRAQGVTGADGYASLPLRVPPDVTGEELSLTISGRRGDFQRQEEHDVTLYPDFQFFVTTDKPLYQPGQVMHVRLLLLDATRHAVANEALRLKIQDPDSTLVYQTALSTSRFGIAQAYWQIPENLKLGDYQLLIELASDGLKPGAAGFARVRISRYELPNFTVNVKPDRAYYLPGQNASVEVSAEYLFGKPVTRGHVRVVRESERRWDFKEQRWDISEEETYEGDTGAQGVFTAHVDLAPHHAEIKDSDYRRFRDLSYSAYFTDPSTGRTEQRRFRLRVTRDPIHVYLIEPPAQNRSGQFPLDFYISAFHADGSPCECEVSIREGTNQDDAGPVLHTVRTNRYGVAKVFGLQLPPDPERSPGDSVDLLLGARDAKGGTGQHSERISRYSDEKTEIRVDTDKSLYRPGEPVAVNIAASERNLSLVFEVWSGEKLLHSQLVKLHGNKAFVMLPFRDDFKGELQLVAYSLAQVETSSYSTWVPFGSRIILYPHDTTLKVAVKLNQATYKPGEEAQASLQVDAPGGTPVQAALGAVVFDKAVEERFRTDQEFGQRGGYGFDYTFWEYWGYDDSLGGLTRADLARLDVSRPFSEDLDVAAEIILNQFGFRNTSVFGGADFPADTYSSFQSSLERQLRPVREALDRVYKASFEYPHHEAGLRALLAREGIRFDALRDPWGMPYHAGSRFSRDQEIMEVSSSGPDKRPGTDDDFVVLTVQRPYFQPTGLAINRALREYHERTGGYMRDAATLKSELLRQGISFDALRDPWGQPYALDFGIAYTRFYTQVTSGGPDRVFEPHRYGDDFTVWTAYSDYFAEMQVAMDAALAHYFSATGNFPGDQAAFLAVLQEAGISLDKLRDGWGRPLYMTFNNEAHYVDRVVMSYTNYLNSTGAGVRITPITQQVSYIHLRSPGEDGKVGTADDFEVATFSRVLAEQTARQAGAQPTPGVSPLAGGTGGIEGTVTDPSGAVIVGAKVAATNSTTQVTAEAITDQAGQYELRNLPVGDYKVQVTAANFVSAIITDVPVRAGQVTELSLALRVGAASETVTVEASAP